MSRLSVSAGFLIVSAASLSGLATQVPDLPAGDMQAKARKACLECHESRIILQQRLSNATWGKEVDKMIKWGALVDAEDRNALVDYLSTNFPADKAPEPASRVPRQKKK